MVKERYIEGLIRAFIGVWRGLSDGVAGAGGLLACLLHNLMGMMGLLGNGFDIEKMLKYCKCYADFTVGCRTQHVRGGIRICPKEADLRLGD